MDEHDEQEEPQRRPRPANEGVRIIGAEEAAAALEKGEAGGRRPEDAPRFGDVPPQPAGPRPAHRFPLPDSVDPASAVPRPPVAGPGRSAERDEPPSLFSPSPVPSSTPPASARPGYGESSHITDPDVTADINTDDVFAPPSPTAPEEPAVPPATSVPMTPTASAGAGDGAGTGTGSGGGEPEPPGAGDRITFET